MMNYKLKKDFTQEQINLIEQAINGELFTSDDMIAFGTWCDTMEFDKSKTKEQLKRWKQKQ